MEKLVLVTHDKYQRLLGAKSTKDLEPTWLKRKSSLNPHLRNVTSQKKMVLIHDIKLLRIVSHSEKDD